VISLLARRCGLWGNISKIPSNRRPVSRAAYHQTE
jgi:hypothetical protein